jgi:uncharacterized protein
VQGSDKILQQIKKSVSVTDPGATVILYGSYARGDYNSESDIDILVLVDKEKATLDDWKRIISTLSNIQLSSGINISPYVSSQKAWAAHRVNPFYENVNREGIRL